MATFFPVGNRLLNYPQLVAGVADLRRTPARGAPADIAAAVEPAPLGVGRPLGVEIRHVYCGRFPSRGLFNIGARDVLITSGVRNLADFPAAPRAVNLLAHVEPHTHLSAPWPATQPGTPVVFYTPAVTNLETTVTIELAFDTFPQEAFDQLANVLQAAGSIPVFATASLYLLAGSVVARLVGKVGEALFDGQASFQGTLDVNFDPTLPSVSVPGMAVVTDDRLPIDLAGLTVDPQSLRLVSRASGRPFDGEQPYVVLRLLGEDRADYKAFRATLASADLLNRFYHVGDRAQAVAGTLVDALKLYNDISFRRKADEVRRALEQAPAGSDQAKRLKQMYDAYAANILEDLLKPMASASPSPSPPSSGGPGPGPGPAGPGAAPPAARQPSPTAAGDEAAAEPPVPPVPAGGRAEGPLPAYHPGMLLVKAAQTAQSRATLAAALGTLSDAEAGAGTAARARADADALMAAAAGGAAAMVDAPPAAATTFSAAPGLRRLAELERAGRVRRATPLSRRQAASLDSLAPAARGGAVAAVAVSAAAPTVAGYRAGAADAGGEGTDLLAGVSLIELRDDADRAELQVALESDPNIARVERVPVRYLVAKGGRPPAHAAADAPTDAAAAPAAADAAGGAAVPAVGGPGAPAARAIGIAAAPPTGSLWNLGKIEWDRARTAFDFNAAAAIRVAVLDTGIDQDHPDLAGRVATYTWDHPDFPEWSSDRDIVGHGTHVAGTIAARLSNQGGISGICPVDLHCWKIFNDRPEFLSWARGYAYVVDPVMYQRALTDCFDQAMDVINLSIGGPAEPDFQERQLFNALLGRGTIICAAMGNARQQGSPTEYPGAIDGVIAVGATNIDDTVAYFSSRGPHIALCAPGMGIWSTLPRYPGQFGFAAVPGPDNQPQPGPASVRDTDYDAWQGTSMATPHVTAAAALLKAAEPALTPPQAKARLTARADKVPDMQGATFTQDYGAGRLNLYELLR